MFGQAIPFRDFAPDLDPFTPGVVLDCDNLFGTVKGLKALPALVTVDGAQLSDPVIGTFTFPTPNGDQLVLAGTHAHIYRLIGGAWELFDGATSEAIAQYGTAARWRMAAFGDYILAVNGIDPVQVSSNYAPFQDLRSLVVPNGTNPPLASIVQTTDYGIFLIQTDTATWFFSPNPLDWTPDISTLTTQGQLTATPGPITAVHRLRDGVAIYKDRSLYYMAFTGPPFVWEPRLVSQQVGCANHESVVNVGDVHLFLGSDDFYVFDGSSLRPLENNLKEWFFARMNDTYRANALARYDRTNTLAFWHYASTASDVGELDEWVCFATRARKWTRGTKTVMDVATPDVPVVLSDMTYEQLGQQYDAYEDLPDVAYDSKLFYSAEDRVPAIIDEAGQLQTYSGVAEDAALLTGNIGDGLQYFQIGGVRPVFAQWPTRALLASKRTRAAGQEIPDPGPFPYPVEGPQSVLQRDGNFNFVSTARVHRFQIETEGDTEIVGLMVDATPMGTQ